MRWWIGRRFCRDIANAEVYARVFQGISHLPSIDRRAASNCNPTPVAVAPAPPPPLPPRVVQNELADRMLAFRRGCEEVDRRAPVSGSEF